jgi:hypothetical protein
MGGEGGFIRESVHRISGRAAPIEIQDFFKEKA